MARPKRLVEYPEADAIDLQNRAMAAINPGQSELFPLEKPNRRRFSCDFLAFDGAVAPARPPNMFGGK